MEFAKKSAKCVVPLAMLITLATSLPIVPNNSTKTLVSRKDEMAQYGVPNITISQFFSNIEAGVDGDDLKSTEQTDDDIDIADLNLLLYQVAEKDLVTYKNFTNLFDSDETTVTPAGPDDENATVYLDLRFDQEYSDVNYTLTVEESRDVLQSQDGRPVVTYWTTPDSKTRVHVSVEQLPNNTGTNGNIEPDRDDNVLTSTDQKHDSIDIVNPNLSLNLHTEKNLVACKNATEPVDSNATTLTPAGHNDDVPEVHLKLRFDQEHTDSNYSLILNNKNAESGVTYEESKDAETDDAGPVLTCWYNPDLKTRVCVSVEQPSNNTETDRNIETDTDDNDLKSAGETSNDIEIDDPTRLAIWYLQNNLVCRRAMKPADSNGTKLTPAGSDYDDDVVTLRFQFDQGDTDGNYSLNLQYGRTSEGDANPMLCWEKLEAHVRLTIEYSPSNVTNSTEASAESREEKMTRYRLPNNTIPRTYYILIEPNMEDENLTWTGMISVDIQVVASTSILTLHAHRNLVIYENYTYLVDSNKSISTPIRHSRDDEVEFLKLHFDYKIPVGEYNLNLRFRGAETVGNNEESKVSSDLSEEEYVGSLGKRIPDGFYKISRTIAGTHFEATKARRAFPCWDEPGLKARFHVTIVHFPNYRAISNMPEIKRFKAANKILTVFAKTPNMSTYLLTFVIFDHVKHPTAMNKYNDTSKPDLANHTGNYRNMLHLNPKVVQVMQKYTGLPFGIRRIGSVVLPSHSTSGTEHWGLVTYRGPLIRFDTTVNTTRELDSASTLIAHELSHSWFGNRVTPLWWNDLWLNEAFATYFQYYIMDKIEKNWRGEELFVVSIIQEDAFTKDNGAYNPVRWTPITNAEIAQMFGPVVYTKGAAILHMFRSVLGGEDFRTSIRKYMAVHSFGTAVADDLIAAFQEVYDQNPNQRKPLNLREVMMSWLEQKGYPMVSVNRNYTTGDTKVSQRSTIIDSPNRWWIPLTFATKSSPHFKSTSPVGWISDKEDCVTVYQIDKDDWIILNIQASGYYRVNYDDENWKRLADYLNTDNYRNIHVLNRAQLINDAFYLAKREPSRYFNIFYRLTDYLSREIEYLPWRSAYNAIIQIEGLLRNTDGHKMFVNRICELMHNYIEKVGFEVRETDDHFTKLSRTDVIHLACRFGHTGCSEHAARKLIKLAENPVENCLHPDTIHFIYCAGLRGLNNTEAKRFAKWAYENTRDSFTENVDCTENHEIHGDIFNAMLTENGTNLIEPYKLFTFLLMSTDENFSFAVDFFLDKHRAFHNANYALNYVPYMVANIFDMVNTRARLEKFEQVLQSDALGHYSKNRIMKMSADAKSKIIDAESTIDPFLELLNKQLLDDNSISD